MHASAIALFTVGYEVQGSDVTSGASHSNTHTSIATGIQSAFTANSYEVERNTNK